MRTTAHPLWIPLGRNEYPPICQFAAWSVWLSLVYWLQIVSCPQTPRYRKNPFVLSQAEYTTLPFLDIKRSVTLCSQHFCLSCLLKACACETCTKPMCCQAIWKGHTHFSQEYTATLHSVYSLFHEVLLFHQATCVLLQTKRWCHITEKWHFCMTLGTSSDSKNRYEDNWYTRTWNRTAVMASKHWLLLFYYGNESC